MFPTILIVDDESSILKTLSGILSDEGFEVFSATNGYEALKIIEEESPDLVLLDIWMPGMDGIDTLKEIRKSNPNVQVVIITGHGTIETAVKATKLGAFDLIEKPLSIDRVIVTINNALNFRRLEEENRYLRKKTLDRHSINGVSREVMELKQQIAVIAPTDSWILITGENGTGKELVARTIHQLSKRAEQPMIEINCAAVPEERIEAELFGQEKGAVNGNNPKKTGKFELADKGTLFLDEIGDMDLSTQSKLLRALEEKAFERIGGSRTISVDVRVIASSNKDLYVEIDKGRFREELYYRLNVVPVFVPPLRKRKEDIPVLADIFLKQYAAKNGEKPKALDEKAVEMLKKYAWPGNVRELKNLMERLSITVREEIIRKGVIPPPYNPKKDDAKDPSRSNLFEIRRLERALRAFEAEFIRDKLAKAGGSLEDAARSMEMDVAELKTRLDNSS